MAATSNHPPFAVVSNDDASGGYTCENYNSLDSAIMDRELSAGDYYIVVEGYSGGSSSFDLLVQESSRSIAQPTWRGQTLAQQG